MKHTPSVLFTVLSLGAALAVSGCGKAEKPKAGAAPAAAAADSARTIDITANDQMKFNVTEIRVKAGEKFRVSLSNIGRMPKQAMGHNWVLLKPMADADVMAFAMAAAGKAPDYLPDDRSAVLAHTKVLGGGEKDQVEVTAPATAGEYPFLCSFPGHAALMKGKLIVE